MAREVEAALRKMKNGKEAVKDQVNMGTLKAGDETIAKQLAAVLCITERRIPKTLKETYGDIFRERQPKRQLHTNWLAIIIIYKMFTKIITTRLDKKLDDNQPRETSRI